MEINYSKKARYREMKSYKFTYSDRETGYVGIERFVCLVEQLKRGGENGN